MDPSDQVAFIRAVIGVDATSVSDARILRLLKEADGDANKAVDLYFQAEAKTMSSSSPANAAASSAVSASSSSSQPKDQDTATVTTGTKSSQSPSQSGVAAQAAASNQTQSTQDLTDQVRGMKELLGNEVKDQVIVDLLTRTNGQIQEAVELYFQQDDKPVLHPPQPHLQQEGAVASTTGATEASLAAHLPSENYSKVVASVTAPLLPLKSMKTSHPQSPSESASAGLFASEAMDPEEGVCPPGVYEVLMEQPQFRWNIGNVFGRAVVLSVESGGPAEVAGIHKSDVLVSMNGILLNDQNCSRIAEQLTKAEIDVPTRLRLRRAIDSHHHEAAPGVTLPQTVPPPPSPTEIILPKDPPTQELKPNGPLSLSDYANPSSDSSLTSQMKFGLRVMADAMDVVIDTIDCEEVDIKLLIHLFLKAKFNTEVAINEYFNDHRVAPDFRQVYGNDWSSKRDSETYEAVIPSGPLGLTVENVLERTIVVDIKPGGAAEKANVRRSSWLVGLNGQEITQYTHRETLRAIETATRPLHLKLFVVPTELYKLLRKQLSMNVRQPKTERPIPEQDRMSFRVFQAQIHQAITVLPKFLCMLLVAFLNDEDILREAITEETLDVDLLPGHEQFGQLLLEDADLTREDAESPNEMCSERRFLLNLFTSIHDYEDKGESFVLKTIRFLGTIGTRCADYLRENPSDRKSPVFQRSMLLLCLMVHVLESLSIIENHATWDVMVYALKAILKALPDGEVDGLFVPLVSRLSVSPSPTARIVPVSLLCLLYRRISGDVLVQLRGMIDRMCLDDNPLVRRAVTSIIGDLAVTCGSSSVGWLVQLLERATGDTHDIVRIFSVKSCNSLAVTLWNGMKDKSDNDSEQARLLQCQMLPMVNNYVSDSSWQVRIEAMKALPSFCLAFGSEYSDIFVDHFVALVKDMTIEVRTVCAQEVYGLADALITLAKRKSALQQSSTSTDGDVEMTDVEVTDVTSKLQSMDVAEDPETQNQTAHEDEHVNAARAKILRSIIPATYKLSTDISVGVRLSLAKSIGQLLVLLGESNYDDLVPLFTQFLEDKEAHVRACLVEQMARHSNLSCESVSSLVFPAIRGLVQSPQWRIRVMSVECIAAWAERIDGSVLPAEFADLCLEMLYDPVCEVRVVTCSKLPILVKCLGDDWLVDKAIPKMTSCLDSTFHGRITGLLAIEMLAQKLQQLDRLEALVMLVMSECSSKTANLRFRALRTLGLVTPLLKEPTARSQVLDLVAKLREEANEPDVDVRETAQKVHCELVEQLAS